MARRFCLVPHYWTAEEVAARRCRDGSHLHLSYREQKDLLDTDLIEWMVFPRVLRLRRQLPLRDLSCRVGEELAVAKQHHKLWAEIMLREIYRQLEGGRETPDPI